MIPLNSKLYNELAALVANSKFERADGGELYFPSMQMFVAGEYHDSVVRNGEMIDFGVTPNILPVEGRTHILESALGGGGTRYTNWYLSLFGGNYTPLSTLTAASYPATAGEITSVVEGYTQLTRPIWNAGVAAAAQIDNVGTEAVFTIATASTLVVYGAALMSSDVKGGTSGVLASATKFPVARSLYDTDEYRLGYRVRLTSA